MISVAMVITFLVSMYVCMYGMYVCMIGLPKLLLMNTDDFIYACMYVCMYVCMNVSVLTMYMPQYSLTTNNLGFKYMYVCMCMINI